MKLVSVRIAVILPALILSSLVSAQDMETPAGMQKGLIKDPVFNNIDAYEVFYPAGWHFQGILLQGTKCKAVPFPVFRAASRDGLTVLERLPQVDLVYGNNPDINTAQSDCHRLAGPMSLQEYLSHLAHTMQVDYVADEPVPQELIDQANKLSAAVMQSFAAQYKAAGMQQPQETVQLARAIVRYKNGSFTIKGFLAGTMDCTTVQRHTTPRSPLFTTTTTCTVNVRYEHAPEDKYEGMIALLDPRTTGSLALSPWMKVWTANNDHQTEINIHQIQRQGAQIVANVQAQGEQFRQSQAVRQRENEDFNAALRRGTDISMHDTGVSMYARQSAVSDMVNYALAQQSVRDPSTGQLTNVSSSQSYTWTDSSSRNAYQTNYSNDNPNGSIPGTWTLQTVTHGNGTAGSPRAGHNSCLGSLSLLGGLMSHVNELRLERRGVPVMAPCQDDASAQDFTGGINLRQHAGGTLEPYLIARHQRQPCATEHEAASDQHRPAFDPDLRGLHSLGAEHPLPVGPHRHIVRGNDPREAQ
jgi:hypothetical protein